jgi:transcriptional regulator with XRE-family HTH domain
MALGGLIRKKRREQGLTLPELARMADVSKGYVSELESGAAGRPSAETLFRIANALGTTISALLGSATEVEPERNVPESLRRFADDRGLPEADIRMLAAISYRGRQPESADDWAYIYDSIRMRIDRGQRR